MNRLMLVPCIVVACYVAVASYFASYLVHELDRPRVGFKIPTFASNRGEIQNGSSSQQTSLVHPFYEPGATTEKPAAAVLPKAPYQDSVWVTVLLPARVHTGPSVDTPISNFYAVGKSLRPRVIGTTGLKSSNQARRNRGGSIENTSVL